MEIAEQEQKKTSSKRVYLIIGITVIAVAAVLYWLKSGGYETTDNAQLDGNIVTLKSRVTSTVDEIYFKDNQVVQKGDTLIKLNTVELETKVQEARAALANAQSGIQVSGKKASASFENATASEQLAKSNQQAVNAANSNLKRAKEEFERNNKLLAIKGITQQDYTASQNRLDLAQADLAQAIGRMQSSLATAHGQKASAQSEEAQIGTAEALVEQRKAELKEAEYELTHAYIIAPCTGIISKRTVHNGNLVNNGQSLCAIVNVEEMWVTANVKESQLKHIRIGQSVTVDVDAYPNVHLTGKVSSFGGATGAKFSLLPPDNATGNFVKIVQRVPIRITLDKITNPHTETPLFPGLSAFVKIQTK